MKRNDLQRGSNLMNLFPKTQTTFQKKNNKVCKEFLELEIVDVHFWHDPESPELVLLNKETLRGFSQRPKSAKFAVFVP